MPVQKLLAKIHIAKKELGLDEETYRDALEGQTGKRSAAEMTNEQIAKCLRHFVSLGWIPYAKVSGDKVPKPKKYDDQKGDFYSASAAIKRKIEAVWHDIYRGNEETKHLRQFLFNHFKVSDIRFLDRRTAYDAVEALKAMHSRRQYAEGRKRENNATN
jgi:phage gp16-like protein